MEDLLAEIETGMASGTDTRIRKARPRRHLLVTKFRPLDAEVIYHQHHHFIWDRNAATVEIEITLYHKGE